MNAPTVLVTLLFPLLLLTSCSPPKEVDYDKLAYSNDVFSDPDTKAPFTGIARQKYKDGKQRAEYPFKNGRFHGTVKEWHPNGKPSAETEFKNGERSGKNIEWTPDGSLFRERVYGEGEKILSEKNYGAAK